MQHTIHITIIRTLPVGVRIGTQIICFYIYMYMYIMCGSYECPTVEVRMYVCGRGACYGIKLNGDVVEQYCSNK